MSQCIILIDGKLSDFPVKAIEKFAVEGRRVSLPCPLSAPSRDKVHMVLWFKNDVKIPMYR
jgi:hypothetical protein